MNKKILTGMLIGMVCIAAGCGNKADAVKQSQSEHLESETVISQSSKDPEETMHESVAASDIYPDGGDIVEVPMGRTVDAVNTKLCSVKLPVAYTIYALYETNEGSYMNMDEAYNNSVSDALDKGAFEGDTYMADCLLMSVTGDPMTELEIELLNESVDEIAPMDDCQMLSDGKYQTYYCELDDLSGYDELVYVVLDDNITALVKYSGPFLDTYGMEAVAASAANLFVDIH